MSASPPALPPLTAAPVAPASDPVLAHDARRRNDQLAHVLEAAAGQSSRAAADRLTLWRALLERLDETAAARMLQEPRYGFWWSRLRGLLRRGEREDVERWLVHLPRFLVVPLARAGALPDHPVAVPLDARGDLRLGGLPARVHVGAAAAVDLRAEGPDLVLDTGGRGRLVSLSDLLAGAELPGVVRHATLLDGRVELDATDPWIQDLFAELRARPAEPPYPQRDATAIDVVPPEVRELYADALALIGHAWPELLDEIAAHVHLVVPFRSRLLKGWAHAGFRGAVFLRVAPGDRAFAFERIAHEAAHVRLYVMSTRALHEDGGAELLPSPLRLDPRPVSGVLHTVFVHGRLIQLYDRAEALLGDGSFGARADELRPLFAEGHDTLRTHARLTEAGARVLDELAAAVEAGPPRSGVRTEAR